MDIFCASQAATSIRLSMDEGSSSASASTSSSSSTVYLGGGGRAIDRYNPIIRDPRRLGKSFPVPSCSSQPPISPKPISQSHPHHHHQNKNIVTVKKNSSKPSNKKKNKLSSTTSKPPPPPPTPTPNDEEKRKSSGSTTLTAANESTSNSIPNRKSWSCSSKAAAADFVSPPGSSRYLLGRQQQAAYFNLISEDLDPVDLKLLAPVVDAQPPHSNSNGNNNNQASLKEAQSTCAFKKPLSSSRSQDQVVVLRVSLHCRGCERKMRKHISRMEGVSSFNIDFAAKKVTVVGDVTPLGVLASISKVKNAQLWNPAGAVPSFSHANSTEINKNSQATTLISS